MKALLLLVCFAGLTGCTDEQLRNGGVALGKMVGSAGCQAAGSCNDFCGSDGSARGGACQQPRY
ncbi:MAG: hypothetical protein Kilf2KO_26370 [Rhodospirillales bacterium]